MLAIRSPAFPSSTVSRLGWMGGLIFAVKPKGQAFFHHQEVWPACFSSETGL